jgi:PIN domain nuclease of toxin-antitoxin system
MKYLLDTHTFLWAFTNDPRLPPLVRSIIDNPNIKKYVSIVSFWELEIKVRIGKLELNPDLETMFNLAAEYEIEILPVSREHVLKTLELPLHHRDPFDRMIIAQSLVESCAIAGKDDKFAGYGTEVVWE